MAWTRHLYPVWELDDSMTELRDLCDGFAPDGDYCCPICLTWYQTREEKQLCLTDRHGYEVLHVTMREPET